MSNLDHGLRLLKKLLIKRLFSLNSLIIKTKPTHTQNLDNILKNSIRLIIPMTNVSEKRKEKQQKKK